MSMQPNSIMGPMTRRQWLRLGAAGAATLCGAPLMLPLRQAHAADYKALVCLFLYGGNDGLNTVTPLDATRYGEYAAVRGRLALPQASLLRLGSSDYGLHPALSALLPIYERGQLAPVFNVGPLHSPLTKAQYLAAGDNAEVVPDALFSHSDQQLLWESASADALTRTGWGGRASDVLSLASPVVSVGGNSRFGVAALRMPQVLPGPGSSFGASTLLPEDLGWAPMATRKSAFDAMYAAAQDSDLGDAFVRQQREAFDLSGRLGAIVKRQLDDPATSAALREAFSPVSDQGKVRRGLAGQLFQIAKLIESNSAVQGNRQIYFAQLGGFDTHAGQVGSNALDGVHANLLQQVGSALAAFHAAMDRLGMGAQVTSFTQSDFGRTFLPNNNAGTDHAWGNHQLVLGGAVKGGRSYGAYPALALGGPDDVGDKAWERQGRWIPTLAVDQYAATLLAWFGADDAQLDAILPNLRNFGSNRSLGFV